MAAQVKTGTDTLVGGQEEILKKLAAIDQRLKAAPVGSPTKVQKKISAISNGLLAKADEAMAAYGRGYELYQRYRFSEAIPHLKKALAIIKVPDFYLALGNAFYELPNLDKAEDIYRQGLIQVSNEGDAEHEAIFSSRLGGVLFYKGDLEGALRYTEWALTIDEKVYGPEHPDMATDASNIGVMLRHKGDLEEALRYSEWALTIHEKGLWLGASGCGHRCQQHRADSPGQGRSEGGAALHRVGVKDFC